MPVAGGEKVGELIVKQAGNSGIRTWWLKKPWISRHTVDAEKGVAGLKPGGTILTKRIKHTIVRPWSC